MIKLICTRSKRVKTSKNVLGFPLKDILLFFGFLLVFSQLLVKFKMIFGITR
jgi:hypothetical protein